MPLYVWLPDAMAGPTPVSALIHAATMVTAGVYLVARSSVLFALAPVASATVAGVGVLTALFAATIALKQNDIKKVLAYSTVSQLGYMFVGVGVGAYSAGIFHLMTHAFFKALLFLGAGAVIHSMHVAYHSTHSHEDGQDMRNMGGLRKHMPITCATMWIATLAIAGIWPFAGFFSKDEIIWQTAAFGGAANAPYPALYTVFWLIALAAAMLTAFYMTRMMVMTFHGENRTGDQEEKALHEAPAVMWAPLAVLAVLAVVGGWVNVSEHLRDSILGLGPLTSGWLHEWLHPITEQAQHIHAGEVRAHFGGEKLNVLLGTQMVAKGLDFPTVTVVGVLNADTALHQPDFRASERCFNLISQVSGRAGRSNLGGKVIVQTFMPDHPSVVHAAAHDFDQIPALVHDRSQPPVVVGGILVDKGRQARIAALRGAAHRDRAGRSGMDRVGGTRCRDADGDRDREESGPRAR